MKCIVHTGAGGADVIAIEERPDPEPGSAEIVVRVRAAGLNRADVLQRRGAYPAPPGWPPDIPGLEYAGVVERVGPGASRWRPGDHVMGLVGGGAHAEYVVVHEAEALPVPEGLDDVQAAAIPEAFLTAWDALVARARMKAGERVLVHAAGSGVGTAAVQLVKRLGGVAIGTSRTAAKLDALTELGLDEAIDTSATGGRFASALSPPVDVILDFFGAGSFAENLGALATRGRLVLLGTLQGAVAERADLGRILRARLEVIGTVMRARGRDERIPLCEAFSRDVLPLFGPGGGLHPVIGAVVPMTEVRQAHDLMERNEVLGKIVLTWTGDRAAGQSETVVSSV